MAIAPDGIPRLQLVDVYDSVVLHSYEPGCKGAATSLRGARAYRRAIPFFFGLILGDVIVASIVSILGLFLGFRVALSMIGL